MSQVASVQFVVRLRGEGARAQSERVIAETWSAGASGHEEREVGAEGVDVIVYCPESAARATWAVARGLVGDVSEIAPVEPVDWVSRWRDSLRATVIGERLVVRPESVAQALGAGQQEVIIEPGQAFGTGGHASTRLILEWLVSGEVELSPSVRVLDVGVGSGVLALAALRLGAGHAVGFDLDRDAVLEAGRSARVNGLSGQLALMAGPIQALGESPFSLVLANLLRSELLPLRSELVSRLAGRGCLLVSGLLEKECSEVEAAMEALGLRCFGRKSERDADHEEWVSLGFRRR